MTTFALFMTTICKLKCAGAAVTTLHLLVTYGWAKKARVPVPVMPVQPYVT